MKPASVAEVVGRARRTIEHLRRTDHHPAGVPSGMWQENVDAFRYLLEGGDLTPFERLRDHTHHITGDPGRKLHVVASTPGGAGARLLSWLHRAGAIDAREFRARYYRRWLRAVRPARRLLDTVVEPAALGGAEIRSSVIDGRPYNFETSRFLVVLQNIVEWGVIPHDRKNLSILDLGGGWGGLAYFLRQVFPASHVTIVDLPETLIFSIPYLMQVDPDRSFYMPAEGEGIGDPGAVSRFDYAFYSPGIFEQFPDRSFDLVVNTGSMAEMTADQVRHYAAQIRRVGRGAFFSFNEERQGRNDQLQNLSTVLREAFPNVWQGPHAIAPFVPLGCRWSN